MADRQRKILILDFGSQYTQLIARRVREANVYSEIVDTMIPATDIAAQDVAGIILSGGPASVHEEGAPACDPGIFELGVPVLGICYGLQWLTQHLRRPRPAIRFARVRPVDALHHGENPPPRWRAAHQQGLDEPRGRGGRDRARLLRHRFQPVRSLRRRLERVEAHLGRAVPSGGGPYRIRNADCPQLRPHHLRLSRRLDGGPTSSRRRRRRSGRRSVRTRCSWGSRGAWTPRWRRP